MHRLAWDTETLAAATNTAFRTAARWVSGAKPLPAPVAQWVAASVHHLVEQRPAARAPPEDGA